MILESVELFGGVDEPGRYSLTEAKREPLSLFDVNSAGALVAKLKSQVKAPWVGDGSISRLGGDDDVSIYLIVSLDRKDEWGNGYLENSRYAKFSIGNDGTMKTIVESPRSKSTNPNRIKKMFRKTHAKDDGDVVKKINKWVSDNA